MTVKEFYLWAKENGYENFEMIEWLWNCSEPLEPDNFRVNVEKEKLILI